MERKYPHWYPEHETCCEYPGKDMVCDEHMPYKMMDFALDTFKDRILCMLGDEIIFSVDARICGRESFCGTLCYVGCDFIIVNVCLGRRPVSMHIPLRMLRFIAPYKS
ncbi:hypothetical protein TcarDRAFT_0797 [Thermosinus carboxydivorans Nor1]|uniref:Uncharacterized protein n=1 Tax=Thermosinus carboxydivorans Nor1 TaxID=401526 RepID=A1HRX6_9FIRM|nr:hypothetical protein [Thermosinus carboxydivorans]EAX47158.1 hypothetical protein TcarDRAFT_0797 [Thermosinus carboxydivorans Nor1]